MDGDDDLCTGNYRATFDATCERTAVVDSHNPDALPSQPAGPFQGPAPLTSASGSCTVTGNGSWEAPGFTAEGQVLVRYSTTIKRSVIGVDGLFFRRGEGRDTIWFADDAPTWDQDYPIHGYVDCADPGGWELAVYEPPMAPVTFPGASMPADEASELLYRVPVAGTYAVDVQLDAGQVNLTAPGIFTSEVRRPRTFSLGTLTPGQVQHLQVAASGTDSQARWRITIRPEG
jgi:hypothetical protein